MATIGDLTALLPCRVLTARPASDRPVCGGYAGDLLSWVMAHAGKGDIWLTILSNINVLAVAELTECACVLLTEDVSMDAALLARADERGIVVLSTPLPTFAAAAAVSRLLQSGSS